MKKGLSPLQTVGAVIYFVLLCIKKDREKEKRNPFQYNGRLCMVKQQGEAIMIM